MFSTVTNKVTSLATIVTLAPFLGSRLVGSCCLHRLRAGLVEETKKWTRLASTVAFCVVPLAFSPHYERKGTALCSSVPQKQLVHTLSPASCNCPCRRPGFSRHIIMPICNMKGTLQPTSKVGRRLLTYVSVILSRRGQGMSANSQVQQHTSSCCPHPADPTPGGHAGEGVPPIATITPHRSTHSL